MRPQVPPGFRLILTDLSLSQVCGRVRSGLTAFFQIFNVLQWTNLGLFVKGKLGEAGWWAGGKVELREDSPAIGDFQAGASLPFRSFPNRCLRIFWKGSTLSLLTYNV